MNLHPVHRKSPLRLMWLQKKRTSTFVCEPHSNIGYGCRVHPKYTWTEDIASTVQIHVGWLLHQLYFTCLQTVSKVFRVSQIQEAHVCKYKLDQEFHLHFVFCVPYSCSPFLKKNELKLYLPSSHSSLFSASSLVHHPQSSSGTVDSQIILPVSYIQCITGVYRPLG